MTPPKTARQSESCVVAGARAIHEALAHAGSAFHTVELVAKGYLDALISMRPVRQIHRVILDEQTGAVDVEATRKARDAERDQRKARGRPYQEFVKQWETARPLQDIRFDGSWGDRNAIDTGNPDQTCPADAIHSVMLPDPKDVRSARLEAALGALKGKAGVTGTIR